MARDGLDSGAVIVTGGASGIGRATAIMLAAAGARVTIADLVPAVGEAVVAEIRETGGEAQFVRTDVTDPRQVENMVARTVARYGALTGAVNSAGLPMCGKRFHELDLHDLDRNLDVNLRATFLCMKAEIMAMLPGGRGSIVNVASMAARMAVPRGAEYCAAKAGVMGLTCGAAADYAADGIRVNAVLPGATLTPMLQAAIDQDDKVAAMAAAAHPVNRLARPEEIASAICWLLSDGAGFVTGLGVPVDGGQGSLLVAPGDRM